MKVILAQALVICIALAGCGGEEPSGGRVKITFATIASPGTPDYIVLQNLLLDFTSQNPNILVDLTGDRLGTSYLIRDIIAHKSADVVDVRAEEIRQLAQQEVFSHLTADCAALSEVITDSAWEIGVLGNELYAVPWSAQPRLLLYNKRMLKNAGIENPPATWQELITSSEKITASGKGVFGFALAGKNSADFGRQYAMFLSQLDMPLLRFENDRGYFNTSTPESHSVLEFVLALHKTAPPESIVTTNADALKQFNANRAAMMLAGPCCIGEKSDVPPEDMGIVPVPAPGYGISKTDAAFRYATVPGYLTGTKREAAIKLIHYLADTGQELLSKGSYGHTPFVPVRRLALQNGWHSANPNILPFVFAIEQTTIPAPAITLEGKCAKDWIGYLHMAMTGRKTKEEALEAARDKGDQALSCIATDIGHPSASMVSGMAVVAVALFFVVAYSVSRR